MRMRSDSAETQRQPRESRRCVGVRAPIADSRSTSILTRPTEGSTRPTRAIASWSPNSPISLAIRSAGTCRFSNTPKLPIRITSSGWWACRARRSSSIAATSSREARRPSREALTIQRKPPEKVLAMRQLVYDNDHPSPLQQEVGWPARWQPEVAATGSWQAGRRWPSLYRRRQRPPANSGWRIGILRPRRATGRRIQSRPSRSPKRSVARSSRS